MLHPRGCKESDTTEQLNNNTSLVGVSWPRRAPGVCRCYIVRPFLCVPVTAIYA